MGAAVLMEFGFDVGFSVARGTAINLGYFGLCGLLMVAAGLVCVAIGARLPGSVLRTALALYVLAHAAGGFWLTVLGMAGACWVWLAPNRAQGMGAGGIVGAALCVTLMLWPYAIQVMAIPELLKSQWIGLPVLVFAIVLVCARFWESVRSQTPALPSFATLSALALALSLAGVAIAVERKRPQTMSLGDTAVSATRLRLPDVFVLVLDTVRADHLSSYGYERDTTPNLARFVAEHPAGVQYELAFSPASWTIPAHSSLLTGTMPSAHGARADVTENFADSSMATIALHADQTLAELLRSDGYCTLAVVANAYLLRVDGLQRGFGAFVQPHPTRPLTLLGGMLRRRFLPGAYAGQIKPYPLADTVNAKALGMYEGCGSRPAFVLANYMDAHSPYLAPPPHAGRFAGNHASARPLSDAVLSDSAETVALKRDRYDESLHFLDSQLQRLLEELDARGALQESWLFITADHGEAFREHGTTSHGSSIYNEQVRIPLIVKPPRGVQLPPAQGPVSLLDVTATIAAIAGHSGFGAGRDLRLPATAGRPVEIEFSGRFRGNVKELFGETAGDPAQAVVVGRFKLLERGGRYELYDLANDPHELVDRGVERAELVSALASALPTIQGASGGSQPGTPSREARSHDDDEALRSLGYLR